ncbi:MAG TPA: hypothetical protein EYN89_13645 [Flavobacteriales bacterium]|nr:hypothetical protein [Flavobacteriales bacterium]
MPFNNMRGLEKVKPHLLNLNRKVKLKRHIRELIALFFLCFWAHSSYSQDATIDLVSIVTKDTLPITDSIITDTLNTTEPTSNQETPPNLISIVSKDTIPSPIPAIEDSLDPAELPSLQDTATNLIINESEETILSPSSTTEDSLIQEKQLADTSKVEKSQNESPEYIEPKPDNPALIGYPEKTSLFHPILGLGGGWLMYMGDLIPVDATKKINNNLGLNFSISTQTNKYLTAGLYFIKGKITVDEKSPTRNLNFQSKITCGGLYISHNFANWIPPTSRITPYMSLGFEAFEFNSKGDTLDANGNSYYYWKDGSIRIEPELGTNPNAATTTMDYLYESDLREANLDGLGKYSQFSLAVPIGVGIQFKITKELQLDIGTSLHFTFTDLLDNISDEGRGLREGESDLEKLLYTSLSLRFYIPSDDEEEIKLDSIIPVLDEDTLETDLTDTAIVVADADSLEVEVADTAIVVADADSLEVEVADIAIVVADADSLEAEVADTAIVDVGEDSLETEVVEISDSSYQLETLPYVETEPELDSVWTVLLGTFPKGEFPSKEFTDQILSMSEVQSVVINDTTFYIKGLFNNPGKAEASRLDITDNTSIKNSQVALWLPTFNTNIKLDEDIVPEIIEPEAMVDNTEFVFRVQLGAFSKLIPTGFFKIGDVVMIPGKDGLYKYVTGEFSEYENASLHKQKMIDKGFDDAFIVVYRGGTRVTLLDAGIYPDSVAATTANAKEFQIQEPQDTTKVEFKIQIFASQDPIYIVPANFKGLENIEEYKDEGLYKYTFGIAEDFEYSRDVLLNQMKRLGYQDAFVVAFINGKRRSILKAHEFINK